MIHWLTIAELEQHRLDHAIKQAIEKTKWIRKKEINERLGETGLSQSGKIIVPSGHSLTNQAATDVAGRNSEATATASSNLASLATSDGHIRAEAICPNCGRMLPTVDGRFLTHRNGIGKDEPYCFMT
jgi:hypothetical protein